MNKKDREQLAKAVALMQEASGILEELASGEREKFDNLPESLQNGERGQAMSDAADKFEEVQSTVDDAVGELEEFQ